MCVYNSCHNSRIYYQICLHLGYKFEQLFIFINTGCATLQSKMWVSRVGTLSTLRKFKEKSFPILVYYGPKKKKWLMSSTFPQKQRELDIKSHQQKHRIMTEFCVQYSCTAFSKIEIGRCFCYFLSNFSFKYRKWTWISGFHYEREREKYIIQTAEAHA